MDGEYEEYTPSAVESERSVVIFEPQEPFLTEMYDKEKWSVWETAVLQRMQDEGFIRTTVAKDIVVYPDKLREFNFKDFRGGLSESEYGISISKFNEFGKTKEKMLVRLFGDRQVLVAGKEAEGKRPLLYIPDNEEQFFNVDQIRRSKAIMGLWEIGRHRIYAEDHPTRSGWKSGTSYLDAALPFVLYNQGRAVRNDEGLLFVDKDPNNPHSERQRISANWMKHQVSFQGPSYARFDTSPRLVVEKHGQKWVAHGLLFPEDFLPHARDKTEYTVASNNDSYGRVEINNRLYGLPKHLIGGKVEQIASNLYLVSRNVEGSFVPDTLFSSLPDLTRVSATTKVENEIAYQLIYVPIDAIEMRTLDQLPKVSRFVYENGLKRRVTESLGDVIPELIQFRNGLPRELKDHMNELRLEQQVGVMRKVKESGEEGDHAGLEFINVLGYEGMILLADSYLEGVNNRRLLDIRLLEPETRQEVMSHYLSLREKGISMINRLGIELDKDNNTPDASKVLVTRMKQAWKYRIADMMGLAATGNSSELVQYFALANEGVSRVAALIESKTVAEKSENFDKNSKTIASAFTFADSAKVLVTLRPENMKNAGARVQVRYVSPSGEEARISLDYDDVYGLSLDMASRKLPINVALQAQKLTYHTDLQFEKGLNQDDKVFADFVRQIPQALGLESTF